MCVVNDKIALSDKIHILHIGPKNCAALLVRAISFNPINSEAMYFIELSS